MYRKTHAEILKEIREEFERNFEYHLKNENFRLAAKAVRIAFAKALLERRRYRYVVAASKLDDYIDKTNFETCVTRDINSL